MAEPLGDFAASRALAARFSWLGSTESTNDDARSAALAGAEEFSVFATAHQTRGRGRLGRSWQATSGKSLAVSVVLRPGAHLPARELDAWGWLPLIAGAALARSVDASIERDWVPESGLEADNSGPIAQRPRATLKWPNDVLIDGYKVCGVLTEWVGEVGAVIVGTGLNLSLDEHDLPTLTSTSLRLVTGQVPDADRVLADYLSGLKADYQRWLQAGGDADAAGLVADIGQILDTLGQDVQISLPDGSDLVGRAHSLDAAGRLVVVGSDAQPRAVSAGDVTHLRLAR